MTEDNCTRMLEKATAAQNKTKESVVRIQRQTEQTEQLGISTLEALRTHGRKLDDVSLDVHNANTKLHTSSKLQDRFDKWSGNLFGARKREAIKQANIQISIKSHAETLKVKEVYENEKYDLLSRKWKPDGMVLCSDPTIAAPALFDPLLYSKAIGSNGSNFAAGWKIDFTVIGLDAEGWTYAKNYKTLNKRGKSFSSCGLTTYVRRRKWKFEEKKGNEIFDSILERQNIRAERCRAANIHGATQSYSSIGYTPRGSASKFKSSGLVREFNDVPDADTNLQLEQLQSGSIEIDQGIHNISRNLENLANIAGIMGEEVRNQNMKIDSLAKNVDKLSDKQTVVIHRSKGYLR